MVRVSRLLMLLGLAVLLLLGSRGVQADVPPPIRIMPLGDSITCSINDPLQASYRYWLYKKLIAAEYSVDFVGSLWGVYDDGSTPLYTDFDANHEGHYQFRADEISSNIIGWATVSQPDVVLIHLGHNDLWQFQSIESTIGDLNQIIDRLRSVKSNVKILLAKVIPAHPSLDDSPLGLIPEFNARIPALAASKTTSISPVRVVDQFTGFDPTTDLVDLVHPDESGEKKMADRWFAVFNVMMRGFPAAYLPIVLR